MDIETEVRTISVGEMFQDLTWREREVLVKLLRGLSNREIGMSLGISHRTVEDHRMAVYRKTGLGNVMEIAYQLLGSPKIVS